MHDAIRYIPRIANRVIDDSGSSFQAFWIFDVLLHGQRLSSTHNFTAVDDSAASPKKSSVKNSDDSNDSNAAPKKGNSPKAVVTVSTETDDADTEEQTDAAAKKKLNVTADTSTSDATSTSSDNNKANANDTDSEALPVSNSDTTSPASSSDATTSSAASSTSSAITSTTTPVPSLSDGRKSCLGLVRQLTSNGELKLVGLRNGFPAHDFGGYRGNMDVITSREISRVRRSKFGVKIKWFRALLSQIGVSTKFVMAVSRTTLLRDSIMQIMRAGPGDMQKMLRVQFINEDAIDAGGVQREWFELLAEAIFLEDSQLFVQTRATPGHNTSGLLLSSAGDVTYDIREHNLTKKQYDELRNTLKGDKKKETKKNDDDSADEEESDSTTALAPFTATHPYQQQIDTFIDVSFRIDFFFACLIT